MLLFRMEPEELFDMFCRRHPNMVSKVVEWRPSDDLEISIDFDDGRFCYFDGFSEEIRWPYRLGCRTREEAWRRMLAFKINRRMNITGTTPHELSERSGISYTTISKYTNGRAMPSAFNLHRLGEALGCKASDFIEPVIED